MRRNSNNTSAWCCSLKSLLVALLLLSVTVPLSAQEDLSLRQAVDLALRSSPLLAVADAGEREAEARIQLARSGYMPHASFSERYERSNSPVFVFTSLLTQQRFTERNFDINALNHPDAISNYQSRLVVEQVLFDARKTSRVVQAARFSRQWASEDSRRSRADVVFQVLQTYFGVALAQKNLEVAHQTVESAQADLNRATSIYQSGRSTQADVLALRVHVAAMLEQQIGASNDLDVARATLNDALGVSLDRSFNLTTPLESTVTAPESSLGNHRHLTAENRAEMRQAEIARLIAHTQQQSEQSAYWPEVVVQGAIESDRQNLFHNGNAYWSTGVTVRWSLWNGGETRARVQQARAAEARAMALRDHADSRIDLELRKAFLNLQAAAQRVVVASAASDEAAEVHRIVQDRHQAGLTTVTELLRSETALAAARTRYLEAVYDQRIAAAALDHAAGMLSSDSALVN